MLPSSGPISFSQIGSYLGSGTSLRNIYTMSRRASTTFQTSPYSVSELYGYGPTTDGLVVYYDSDYSVSYPGSGTTWTSPVGSITATMNGAVGFTTGTSGDTGVPSYFTFDGTAKYFVINNDLYPEISSTGDMTINAWFSPTSVTTRNVLISKWGTSGGTTYFVMEFGTLSGVYTNSIRVYLADANFANASVDIRGSSNMIVANPLTPYMLTFRYIKASATTQIYLNGALRTVTTASFNPLNVPATWNSAAINWYMATYRPSNPIDARCKFYNLMMYNRALSAAEILNNYNSMGYRYGVSIA